MNLLSVIKQALPHETRQRMKRKFFHVNDMFSRLENLRNAGFKCTGFIDGGAYEGEWTRQFWRIYPAAPGLLIDPLPAKQKKLKALCLGVPGSSAVMAALGSVSGKVRFRASETNSSVVDSANQPLEDSIEVDMLSLDELLKANDAFQPNLLKLDLQGYELECLNGCTSLEKQFEVLVIEISLIPIGGTPLLTEVNNYLENRGYRIYDVIPQYYRPLDGALWQCDAIYVRKDSALLASMRWD